jgi:uncharacterized integral membrane protein
VKTLFYLGIIGLSLFEVLKVYFIMPMPGSQNMNSIEFAYFLHTWRWPFRLAFLALIIIGAYWAYVRKRWLMLSSLTACLIVVILFNFKLSADKMFYQPTAIFHADSLNNKIPLEKLILGIHMDNEARAYPIQLIAYHHQVLDTLAGQPIMVTYCSVCRSGRIFEPKVNGTPESFRLVGMDHFNAMFEDRGTASWWRQVNGEAIAGPLKGVQLPELMSEQTTLKQWLERYPKSLVMQHDSIFTEEYEDLNDYDFGIERGELTRTDTLSWQEKSWVVGIEVGKQNQAIDWNRLKKERIINQHLNGRPVLVVLASDDQSFFAYERPETGEFKIQNDTLFSRDGTYTLWGDPLADSLPPLKRIRAYQEFWHSWRTFHPSPDGVPSPNPSELK